MERLKQPPRIDGVVEEAEWHGSLDLGELTSQRQENEIPRTRARIAMDHSMLYLSVECDEPLPGEMKTATIPDEKDGAVWKDDSVEVFLDIGNTGRSIFHLVANSAGTLYDSQIINSHASPTWDSGAQVQAHVGKKSWSIEMAIPMQALGHQLERGEVFSLNVARSRHVDGRQLGSLAGGRFAFPKYFVPLLVEGPVGRDGYSIVSTRRGPFFPKDAGVWEFEVTPEGEAAAAREVVFTFSKGGAGRTVREKVEGQRRSIAIPIKAGEASAMSGCTATVDGQEVFRSEYEVQAPVLPERVSRTLNPLFETLIEPRPDGLSKEGVLIWPHEINRPSRKELPFRTGAEFSLKDPYRQYARDRGILIGGTGMGNKMLTEARELGIPVAIYLNFRKALKAGAPLGVSHRNPWKLDPRAIEAYLDDLREGIRMSKTYPNIQWMFAGDEQWEIMHRNLLGFLDQKETYPELQAVDAEVREKFGFGKFGLPESSSDTNPYRWIATLRWELAKMMEVEKQARKIIEEEAPQMKFLSWDNISGHRPYGLRRWGEVFDVITGQLYPNTNPNFETFGFITKFLADLSEAKEVWPVPHVEHYGSNFTAAEVEELLSQTLRNGATGFHFYFADVVAARAKEGTSVVDRIGAPERWRVIESVTERLKTPFVVRQPEPDSAIFYSNTSYMGQGTGQGRALNYTNEVEWLYTLLGPRLGSAFKFIDDFLCQDDPGKLARYKAIYIPYAPIADDAEYEALEAFVKAGGSLVICDPLAFRHRSDGTERTEGALLPPLKSLSATGPQRSRFVQSGETRELRAAGSAYPLKETGKALAHFMNGNPAVIETALGKGKVIFFAATPLVPSTGGEKAWAAFFGDLQKDAGATLNHDVWRFRLPESQPPVVNRPGKSCLTGNYFEWSLSKPTRVAASGVKGSYRLSRPDRHQAEPAEQSIAFEKGRLTDRLRGALAANDAPISDFILEWQGGEALTVTFQFDQAVTPTLARLFFSGALPPGSVEVSSDGTTWEKQEGWSGADVNAEEVKLASLTLNAKSCTHLRLTFEPTAEKKAFTLVEIDLWSDDLPL